MKSRNYINPPLNVDKILKTSKYLFVSSITFLTHINHSPPFFFYYRPLKTQKMRDGEDQEKLKKHPKTTIRIRMPDHTIVQAVFQTKERGNIIIKII